jgi:hypothetical protein
MKTCLQITIILILSTQLLIAGTYGGGSGTLESPYQIATAAHLSELSSTSSDWATGIYFKQMNNITVSGEWSPIGNSTTNFRGSYNGQEYTISGVTITDQFRNGYWGFFGYTNGATIQNLGLISISISEKSEVGGLIGYAQSTTVSNCYTTGSVSGYYGYVGGLIADTYGTTISDCYSTVTVTGGTSGGGSHTGGLVGRCTNSSPISNSYHITGNVSGRDYVGGLVGVLESFSSVSQCYSSGSVSGTSAVGGVIGSLSASVYDSYSRANVFNSGPNSGGLVGQNVSGSIDKCYSTGTATGSANVGGLLGYNDGGSTTNSFWDTETSSQDLSAGGFGRTTTEMKTASTFIDAGWNSDTWYIDAGFNNGYPYLHWQNAGTPLPVELTSFTATINERGVTLNWQTATEVNNYGFEVERIIKNSKLKNQNWETIGFVKGKGNSNSLKEYSFTDKLLNLNIDLDLNYRLKQIDNDGQFTYSEVVEVTFNLQHSTYELYQNYPNPFNPETKIKFSLPNGNSHSFVTLKVYDILGNEVSTLLNDYKEPGLHEVNFNASSAAGGLSTGVYFYRLQSGSFIETKKLLLVK